MYFAIEVHRLLNVINCGMRINRMPQYQVNRYRFDYSMVQ